VLLTNAGKYTVIYDILCSAVLHCRLSVSVMELINMQYSRKHGMKGCRERKRQKETKKHRSSMQ
jgi:hypothetical protein